MLGVGQMAHAAGPHQRVALVIGNAAYTSVPPLANPTNDADAVARMLKQLQFEVIAVVDGDKPTMENAIHRFEERLSNADVGVFFYAGHALQVGGVNYLMPTTADVQSELQLELRAIRIDLVQRMMDASGALVKILILDACRDNPFRQNLARAARAGTRSTVVGRGLAEIDGTAGTMIAFATAPGDFAADGKGQHSPFTSALLEHMAAPGLEVAQMFRRVRRDVILSTANTQVPWVNEALVYDFYFNPAPAFEAAAQRHEAAWQTPGGDADLAYWDSIKGSTDPADYRAYLRKFPNGLFADLARRRAYPAARPQAGTRPSRPQPDQGAAPPTPLARSHPMDGAYEGQIKCDYVRDRTRKGECLRGRFRLVVENGSLQFYVRDPRGQVGLGSDKARVGMQGEMTGRVEDDGRLRDVTLVMKMLGMEYARLHFDGTVTRGSWTHPQRLCRGSYSLARVD